MFFRLVCVLFAALIGAGLCGCYSTAEGQLDDQKNPYFMAAKDRVSARDYKGAIELFEKALEVNPRSALAHFELGVLYEQRDEHENHFISAMYHYKRAIDLRPHGSPADIAKQRMAGCKQELVKSESLAPVYQAMQRDFDKLKEENQFFRKQVEGLQVQLTNRMAELRMQSQSQNQTISTIPNLNYDSF